MSKRKLFHFMDLKKDQIRVENLILIPYINLKGSVPI